MYGGRHFEGDWQHPGIGHTILSGPNQGDQSSAAGRYQFLKGTWEEQTKKYGYKDFSPANQDLAAWNYANDVYKAKTGGDLASVLQSGDNDKIANVGKVLSGTWTSLPGGIEQSTGTNQFVATYQKALGNPSQAVAASAADTAAKMTVAENDAQTTPGTVGANDPISQYMMATQLMGGKGSKPASAPPAAAPQKVAVAVDPLQFIQDPTQREALRRRQTYGLA
jgi:muramidase (phage lysozyme)